MNKERNAVTTLHNLDFECAEWRYDSRFMMFKVGTCEGLWTSTSMTYDILAIDNSVPGNGHFEDVLQWFEHSCRRDKKNLRFLEIMNIKFKIHLISKRGFVPERKTDNVIKRFSHGLVSVIPKGIIEYGPAKKSPS